MKEDTEFSKAGTQKNLQHLLQYCALRIQHFSLPLRILQLRYTRKFGSNYYNTVYLSIQQCSLQLVISSTSYK